MRLRKVIFAHERYDSGHRRQMRSLNTSGGRTIPLSWKTALPALGMVYGSILASPPPLDTTIYARLRDPKILALQLYGSGSARYNFFEGSVSQDRVSKQVRLIGVF